MDRDDASEGPGDDQKRLAEIERIKLSATFFNTIASGSVLAGIVIPAASILAGTTPNGGAISGLRLAVSAAIWLLTGAALHFFARRLLGSIDR